MSKKDQSRNFDFDEWVTLAREDPERFERLREEKIRDMIAAVPENMRQRMQGLQWRIDRIRQTANNPMASCLRLSSMMWDSVLGEDGLVQTIEDLGKTPETRNTRARREATVIHFDKSGGDAD